MSSAKPMTIGRLARRSGVSVKVLREYERRGLLYTLGRSASNYRLFDESSLWCLQVIHTLRSLGLTLKEIQAISAIYCEHRGKPMGPPLAQKLDQALAQIEARLSELQTLRQRILHFQAANASALSGQADLALYAADPRRSAVEARQPPLDSPLKGKVYIALNQLKHGGRNGRVKSDQHRESRASV